MESLLEQFATATNNLLTPVANLCCASWNLLFLFLQQTPFEIENSTQSIDQIGWDIVLSCKWQCDENNKNSNYYILSPKVLLLQLRIFIIINNSLNETIFYILSTKVPLSQPQIFIINLSLNETAFSHQFMYLRKIVLICKIHSKISNPLRSTYKNLQPNFFLFKDFFNFFNPLYCKSWNDALLVKCQKLKCLL